MTDFLENGSISSFFNSSQYLKMTPTDKCKIIFGISVTMNTLHENNMLNIDLENSKILLDNNLEPKLNIFSISKYLSNRADYEISNFNSICTAPEISVGFNEEYDFSADVYSFAMFLYSMLSKGNFIFAKSTSSRLERIYIEKRPKRPYNIPDNYWELIQQCWSNIPISRPTFEEITNALLNDQFSLIEVGVTTDFDILHEYQNRFE